MLYGAIRCYTVLLGTEYRIIRIITHTNYSNFTTSPRHLTHLLDIHNPSPSSPLHSLSSPLFLSMQQRRVRRTLLPQSISTPARPKRAREEEDVDIIDLDTHHTTAVTSATPAGNANTPSSPQRHRAPEALVFDNLSCATGTPASPGKRGTPQPLQGATVLQVPAKPALTNRPAGSSPAKKVRILDVNPVETLSGPLPLGSSDDTPQQTPLPARDYTNKGGGAELVVVVGGPCSGKTTFAKNAFVVNGYTHVNPERIGTRDRCLNTATTALKKGRRVVVDMMNPDVESRALFIRAAHAAGVKARCMYMDTPLSTAKQLNTARTQRDPNCKPIPQDAFTVYTAKLQPPSLAEDFTEIHAIRLFGEHHAPL